MEAPGEELTMAKFMNKPIIVDAVQLRWDNWSEMCEHAGVGEFSAGKPQGCYVEYDKKYADWCITDDTNGRLGLKIPTLEGPLKGCVKVAVEGDWIVRDHNGELSVCKQDVFAATYNPFEWGSWDPKPVMVDGSWMCPKCGTRNSGRMEFCGDGRCPAKRPS